MEFLSQFLRIGLALIAFVTAGVLIAPAQPTLLTARSLEDVPDDAATQVPEPAAEEVAALEAGPAEPSVTDTPTVEAPSPADTTAAPTVTDTPAATDDEVPVDVAAFEPPADAPLAVEPIETPLEEEPVADGPIAPPAVTSEADEPDTTQTASIETEAVVEHEQQPLGLAELTAEPPPLDFRLYRAPEVSAATEIEADGAAIRLAGLEPLAANAACADGARCGAEAREAVDEFLRGRAIICSVPIGREGETSVTAPCLVGEEDIGAWIVANGWAAASAGSRYREAEEEARAEGRGIWANGGPSD